MTNLKNISLLPYLQNNVFCLHFEFENIDDIDHQRILLDDAINDPISKIYKASIMSSSGTCLNKLIALISSDTYLLSRIDKELVSNKLIDGLWCDTIDFYASLSEPLQSITLVQQDESPAQRFKSLFFCKTKHQYFHPPCPYCGEDLELLEDDILLESKGLPPYSSTLDRFLFCPTCLTKGHDSFFAYQNPSFQGSGVSVQDSRHLIMLWKHLFNVSNNVTANLPCFECLERDICFNGNLEAMKNIFIFAFYPFYMLLLKAPAMSARFYLDLVSGKVDNSSDVPRALFFKLDHPNSFYEVLFLKLSFLSQLYKDLFQKQTNKNFRASALMDRLWIDLPETSQLLPSLWSFRPRILGLLEDIQKIGKPKPFLNHIFLDFALIWFSVLCLNKKNSHFTIKELIENLITLIESKEAFSYDSLNDSIKKVLNPCNLFWDGCAFEITEQHYQLWQEVMDLGIELIRLAWQPSNVQQVTSILEKIESIAEKAKTYMFVDKERNYSDNSIDFVELEIAKVLDQLISTWQQNSIAKKIDIQKPQNQDIDTHITTEVLPPSNFTEEDFLEETLQLHMNSDEELPETVILSNNHSKLSEEDIKKIVDNHKNKYELESSPLKDQREEDDFLEETVILKPPSSKN